jgi:hypothetical protein
VYMDVLASYVESVGPGPCAFPDRMWAIQYSRTDTDNWMSIVGEIMEVSAPAPGALG